MKIYRTKKNNPAAQKGSYIFGQTGFTLIELLVVVAIIAILSVFVILTLNPAELLRQGRDSQRVSDIATINSALNLYQVDVSNGSLGTASTTYISIPDNTATSTAGTQCQGLGLPALPTGWTYHCAASSTYKNTDGTGWVPVNFSSLSYGNPLGSLPVDPINNASTSFYTYTPGGSWQLTAIPESSKIRTTQANQITGAITQGSNLSLSPLFNSNGLVGYWKFDETSGATSTDSSGIGNNGTLVNGATWTSGKIGNAAGLDGSNDYVLVVTSTPMDLQNITVSMWVKFNAFVNTDNELAGKYANSNGSTSWVVFRATTNYENNCLINRICFLVSPPGTGFTLGQGMLLGSLTTIQTGSWYYMATTYDSSTNLIKVYINGALENSMTRGISSGIATSSVPISLGGNVADNNRFINGAIDDVRLYNRALSAAEILSLYNSTK